LDEVPQLRVLEVLSAQALDSFREVGPVPGFGVVGEEEFADEEVEAVVD
jgi:hypothetical protein